MSVKSGKITDLKIMGDYFFTLPTQEFIDAMVGIEHTREAIEEKIERIEKQIENYFSGISKEEIISMFF